MPGVDLGLLELCSYLLMLSPNSFIQTGPKMFYWVYVRMDDHGKTFMLFWMMTFRLCVYCCVRSGVVLLVLCWLRKWIRWVQWHLTACSERISCTWVPAYAMYLNAVHICICRYTLCLPKNVICPLICDFYFSTYIFIFITVKSILNLENKWKWFWKGKWLYFQYMCSLYHIPYLNRLYWLKYALAPFFWTCVYVLCILKSVALIYL